MSDVKFMVRGRLVSPEGKDLGPAGKTESKPAQPAKTDAEPDNAEPAPKPTTRSKP